MAGLQLHTRQYTDDEYMHLVRSVPNGFWWWGKRTYVRHKERSLAKLRLIEVLLYTGTDESVIALSRLLTKYLTTFDAELAEIDNERRKRRQRI